MKITKLLTEYQENPIGLDEPAPAFSWQLASARQNVLQQSYRLQVLREQTPVWDSGRVESRCMVNVLYAGEALQPCTRYTLLLTVWDTAGLRAEKAAWFETGLMNPSLSAWEGAQWIAAPHHTISARTRGVFRIGTSFRLAGAQRAGLVFGARDERLLDESLNEYGLAGENYIRYEINAPDQSLDVYRVGYAPQDEAEVPFARLPLNAPVDDGFHRLEVLVTGNQAQVSLDGATVGSTLCLNPRGGNDVLTYPRLNEIGFFAQGRALFKELTVANVRAPGAVYINEQPGSSDLFAALKVEDGCFAVDSQQFTANPSRNGIPMLHRSWHMPQGLTRARLYITARGIYEAQVNGHTITNSLLAPGLTQYDKRLHYQTYDLTSLLTQGENHLNVTLASGWWSDAQTYTVANYNYFGDKEALLCKLVLEYANGTRQVIVSQPEQWDWCGEGPWRYAGLFMGEEFDARRMDMPRSWERPVVYTPAPIAASNPGFGRDWPAVNQGEPLLIGGYEAPVQVVETRTAQQHIPQSDRVHLYDFGQEMAGVPEITFHEAAGTRILIRYGEMLYPNLPRYGRNIGRLMRENYRDAESTDVYICRGDANGETYRPRFTFHGFRYVEVNGVTHAPQLAEVKAHQYSSITEFDGSFRCSDSLLTRFAENVKWSQRCNFISIPTDCPQRNERMGWAGDTHVFCSTALHNANLKLFYERNLQAMADLQEPDGRLPEIAPIGAGFGGITYECAAIFMAWELYQQYGDKRTVQRLYPVMERSMDYMAGLGMPGVGDANRVGPLADWLAFEDTDPWLMWNTFYYREAALMERFAILLDKPKDAARYGALKERIRQYWNAAFVDASTHRTACDTQCSYALPIAYGIADNPQLLAVQLARKVRENGYRVGTGFFGTGLVSKALSDHGYREEAWRMLLQRAFPSWLYPVTQGATTIWEHWDSFTQENGFGDYNAMNSFNHYSLGSVLSWMYDEILGIQRQEEHPGFTHFLLKPDVRLLDYASGSVASPAGTIESGWARENGCIRYTCTLPANTTATLVLPDGSRQELGSGCHTFTIPEPA